MRIRDQNYEYEYIFDDDDEPQPQKPSTLIYRVCYRTGLYDCYHSGFYMYVIKAISK